MAFYSSREAAVMLGSTAEYARIARVSPEFFHVFAVEPILGRSFTAEEMKPGSGGALIISYAYWQSHFGGDPRALGQTVRVYGSRPITGVLPPGFRFPNNSDLWVPANVFNLNEPRSAQKLSRCRAPQTRRLLEQAQTEMTSIADVSRSSIRRATRVGALP